MRKVTLLRLAALVLVTMALATAAPRRTLAINNCLFTGCPTNFQCCLTSPGQGRCFPIEEGCPLPGR